jgi:hypothetical protein
VAVSTTLAVLPGLVLGLNPLITSAQQDCAKIPPGHLIAPGQLKKNGGVAPTVPDCQVLPPGIQKKVDNPQNPPGPPSGSGGDKTAPLVSGITVTAISNTSATINWSTNEAATSKVWYATSLPVSTSSQMSVAAGLVTTHAVVLTGLSASTQYFYLIETADAAGNVTMSGPFSFMTVATADTTAPSISSIAVTGITQNGARIDWHTNESATSVVWYSTNTPVLASTSSSQMAMVAGLSVDHSVALTGLNANTTYYYLVQSADAAGNMATSSQASFATTAVVDTTAPVITGVAISAITTSTAHVAWNTNENADSKVWFSTVLPVNPANPTASSTNATLVTSHGIDLTGLSANTTYFLVVDSTDAAGNRSTAGTYSFTTLSVSADVTAPIVSGVNVTSIGQTTAMVNWNTNEGASSIVWYSTSSAVAADLATSGMAQVSGSLTAHAVPLTGLSASTTYYYLVESSDAAGNRTLSGPNSFTTTAASADTTAPVISAITVSGETSSSVTVNWSTNEAATSKVWFSASAPVILSTSSSMLAESAALVTNHSLVITGLQANFGYHFVIQSADASGNVATSSEGFMSTLP